MTDDELPCVCSHSEADHDDALLFCTKCGCAVFRTEEFDEDEDVSELDFDEDDGA